MYSIFVTNSDDGLFEFADLNKTDAMKLRAELRAEKHKRVEMIETYRTPYFIDTVFEEERNDNCE